jgi:hypothetical protein
MIPDAVRVVTRLHRVMRVRGVGGRMIVGLDEDLDTAPLGHVKATASATW